MTDIEKLEDILHRETIKKLEADIDEIPNTAKDIEKELRDTLTELNSYDLFTPHAMKLNQTMWKEKFLKPQSELKSLRRHRQDLTIIYYAKIGFALLQTTFVMGLLWFITI